MIDTGIALRYARALYEVAAARGETARVAEDMDAIDRLLGEAPPVRRYCLRGRENRAPERDFIRIAFLPYVGPTTGAALKAAVRQGRLAVIPFLPAAYREVADRRSDTIGVVVETARPPEPGLLKRVAGRMQRRLARKIRVSSRIVPELTGGLRIEWNHRMIDASAAGRLKQMRMWIRRG